MIHTRCPPDVVIQVYRFLFGIHEAFSVLRACKGKNFEELFHQYLVENI